MLASQRTESPFSRSHISTTIENREVTLPNGLCGAYRQEYTYHTEITKSTEIPANGETYRKYSYFCAPV